MQLYEKRFSSRNALSIGRIAIWAVCALLSVFLLVRPVTADEAADIDAFGQRVISIAAQEYPDLNLKKTDKPLVFTCTGGKLSVDNLFKAVKEQGSSVSEDEEIKHFLKHIIEMKEVNRQKWDEVKVRLRPQIFPKTYLKQTNRVIVTRSLPFSKRLLEGFVIDSENSFQYVTKDHMKHWNVDIDTVSKCAYSNLDKASQDLKFEVTEAGGEKAKGKYVTISVSDGYAAARILLPEVRKRLQKDLGDPCFIAIPNRDFLIGWSPDFTHKDRFVEQVRKDFASRHHPLTPQVYELDASNLSNATEQSLEASDAPKRRHRRRH